VFPGYSLNILKKQLFFKKIKYFDFQSIDYMHFHKYLLFMFLKECPGAGDTR